MHIVSRSEWGARHDNGFGSAPLPAKGVYLHHSVTAAPDLVPPFDDEDAAMRTLERIGEQRFSGGVSYTFAVMPSGRVYEGHGVGRRGAHTKGLNSTHRAIVLVGDYEKFGVTSQQVQAVADLLRHGKAQGWWREAKLAGGHRDAPGAQTACPGRHAYALIGEINRRASDDSSPAPSGGAYCRQGDRSDRVLKLQRFMTRVFPTYNSYRPTSFYGLATRDGVREFQKRTGITGPDADGSIVGPRTLAALQEEGFTP
jgi:hypothetical protein